MLDEGNETDHFYNPEFLNSIRLSSLPAHELKLKINQPIMPIRNISPSQGLCNGTRLIIKGLIIYTHLIEGEILTGSHKGFLLFKNNIHS